jgi:hypothetical protein
MIRELKKLIKQIKNYFRKSTTFGKIGTYKTNMSPCGAYLFVYKKGETDICHIYKLRNKFEVDELFYKSKINISSLDLDILMEFLRNSD